MKRKSLKAIKDKTRKNLEEIQKEQQAYHKLSKTISQGYLKRSQHRNVISLIDSQLKRPQTSYALRKDYRSLKKLANCTKKLEQSKEKSLKCYQRICNLKFQQNVKELYDPLSKEIRKSLTSATKQKYTKISLKLDRPLINNGINSNHFDSIDMDLNSGLSDIKSIIPERYELDKKFLIFGELVEEEKEKYILEIKKFLEQKYKNKNSISDKEKKYVINHFLLQKFLQNIYSDTSTLQLKNKYRDIYNSIKKEMIQELIQESKSMDILQNVLQYEKRKSKGSKSKIKKKQSNIFMKTKENDNLRNFQKIYNIATEKVDEAIKQFNESHPKVFKVSKQKSKDNKWVTC